ncbi:unnamed protein product [Prunus brigantina]
MTGPPSSSNPSQAMPLAAVISPKKVVKSDRVLTVFPRLRSPSSGHRFRQLDFQIGFWPVLGSRLRLPSTTFWGRSKNKSGSK